MSTRWLRWLSLSAVFWTAIGLIFALPQLGHHADLRQVLLSALAHWWAWGLLVPGILALDTLLPISARQVGRRVLAHLLLGPAITVVYTYILTMMEAAFRLQPWSRLVGPAVLNEALREMFWSMLVYCLIVGVWEAYIYHARYVSAELQMERLQRSFSEARLNALRMQLDPHFLFNALNTVSAQVEREPKLARQMIEHLGDLLRLSLNSQDRQEIPLTEELAFLDHYLAIQSIRFGEKLNVELRIAPAAKSALVPSLFIQPLIENSIRHGISKRARGGSVVLSAQCIDRTLMIQVLDDGVGLPGGWSMDTQSGLGLSITRERILGLHPHGVGTFEVKRRDEGGTAVLISFPLRTMKEVEVLRAQ